MRPFLLALLGALAVAGVAQAAAPPPIVWQHDGSADPRSPGTLTCAGGGGGTVTPAIGTAEITTYGEDEVGAGGRAGVRVPLSLTGADGCLAGGGTRAQVEVVAPTRTGLLSADDYGVDCGPAAALVGCRAAYRPGVHGGMIVDDARSGTAQPWAVGGDATQPTYVSVPVIYEDVISTFGTSTEQRCGAVGVCAPSAAAGRVQVVVTFLPGTGGTPAAPVFTTVGMPNGGDVDCCGDIDPDPDTRPKWFFSDKLPTRLARKDLGRGYRFYVHLPKGTQASVALKKGSTTIASVKRAGKRDDIPQLVLKVGPKALKRLGSSATLVIKRTGGTANLLTLQGPVKVTGR